MPVLPREGDWDAREGDHNQDLLALRSMWRSLECGKPSRYIPGSLPSGSSLTLSPCTETRWRSHARTVTDAQLCGAHRVGHCHRAVLTPKHGTRYPARFSASWPSMHPHDARHCHRCAGVLAQDRETVPYMGPGPRVVELRHVLVLRCTGCTHMSMEVPEPRSLDTLIRCLAGEMEGTTGTSGPLPQLAFEQGRWCILPRWATA